MRRFPPLRCTPVCPKNDCSTNIVRPIRGPPLVAEAEGPNMSGGRLPHLVRRWWTSVRATEPTSSDDAWVNGLLLEGEREIFRRMSVADRSHAITVARRFGAMLPDATREALAAALLHDVGKVASNLGSTARVVATILGPRGERFRRYHDHEALGIEMCRNAGSAPATLALLEGRGSSRESLALRDADHI